MINNIVFEGNLTRDPEFRFFPNGERYAILSIANSKKYKKQNGEEDEKVCFIETRVFGKSVSIVERFLEKGKRLIIQGEINFDQWETEKGEKKSKHFIVAKNISIITFKDEKKEEDTTISIEDNEIPF